MRVETLLHLLLLGFGLFFSAVAQSNTSSSQISSAVTTRATSLTTNGTAVLPANGTTTLSANGIATATIVNGTLTLSTTPTSSAAFPSLTGVSPCVVGCITVSVAQSNCSAITDEKCFCSSPVFRNATVQCVSSQCPSQLADAESLAQRFCAMVSVSLTFPSPTVSGTTPATPSAPSARPNAAQEIGHLPTLAALCGITFTMIVFGFW